MRIYQLPFAFLFTILIDRSQSISSSWKPIIPDSSIFSSYRGLSSYPHFSDSSLNFQSALAGSDFDGSGVFGSPLPHGRCLVEKYAFDRGSYLEYGDQIPDMKEFTLCLWTRFYNHSNDHPLFSYSVYGEPREISLWVSNVRESSYFSMAVGGQTLYRLNYPLRLDRWHHVCSSWNGRTGEWQVWVKAERVGRGFHNRLVGHVIKGGGKAVTGLEQDDGAQSSIPTSGNAFAGAKQPPAAFMGELTMLQLYRIALSAGKAHRDHKHHHVHHFRYDGGTTPAPPTTAQPAPPVQPINPLLSNGQRPNTLQLNLGGQIPQSAAPQIIPVQLPNGQQLNQQYINGQFANTRLVAEQLLGSQIPQQIPPQQSQLIIPGLSQRLNTISGGPQTLNTIAQGPQIYTLGPSHAPGLRRKFGPRLVQGSPSPRPGFGAPLINSGLVHHSLTNPANVQYIDSPVSNNHFLFKRDNTKITKISKRSTEENQDKNQKKRALVQLTDGSIVDDASYLQDASLSQEDPQSKFTSFLDGLGLTQYGSNFANEQARINNVDYSGNGNGDTDDEVKEYDREPAEAEVKLVLNLCDACSEEPFLKALVLEWKNVQKSSHGAGKTLARNVCGDF